MSINSSAIPSFLKLIDVTHDISQISRYQPVKFLVNLSKIFDNILYNQMAPHFEIWNGFQKGFNPKNYLLQTIKNFRNDSGQKGEYAALCTGPLKATDWIPQYLKTYKPIILICHN